MKQKKTKNTNIIASFLVSIVMSFCITGYKFDYDSHSIIKSQRESFELFISQLKDSVKISFLIGKLLSSKIHNEAVFNDTEISLSPLQIENGNLVENMQSHVAKYQDAFSEIYEELPFFDNKVNEIYIRDYVDNSLMIGGVVTSKPNNLTVSDKWFTHKCREKNVCTSGASKIELNDGILISDIYTSGISKSSVMTFSSPVLNENNELAIDVHFNINLDVSAFLSDKNIVFTSDDKVHRTLHISFDKEVLFSDLGLTFYNSLSNTVNVSYFVPLELIMNEYVNLFFILFLCIFALHYHIFNIVNNNKEMKELMNKSYKDELTNVYNRHILKHQGFIGSINQGGVIASIDGNSIKSVNDTYGHKVGDLAIMNIARALQKSTRDSDYIIRLGGDEFIVFYPKCHINSKDVLMKKINDELSKKPFFRDMYVSVSVGFGELSSLSELELAIESADFMMYGEKEKEKEKIVS